ncbi:MAG TPA: ABC transporter permease [Actinomycetota bacterium]|nr:ABC transporter permease [Actinomycetota bacterium]
MLAMAIKEFRQLRRDRRTLAMLVVLPLVLLTVFGYAASFDVPSVRTIVVGPRAEAVAARVPAQLDVVAVRPADGRAEAVRELRDGRAGVALVTGGGDAAGGAPVTALVDGADLFSARAAVQALTQRPGAGQAAGGPRVVPEVLFNPELRTPVIMVPGLVGIILVFVGTMATALGVVRERQSGTLEQLAVMPFRPRDVFLGKVLPYFGVATVDLTVILVAAILLFHVPFRGSVAVFALGALLFLFVTLGLGVLISTVSENQGQAIQLAIMTLLPQVLLSGLIFPLHAMAAGVRWIGYVLPLTYFIQIARGVMVRGTPLEALAVPLLALAGLGLAVFTLSVVRFRRDLAPAGRPGEREPRPEREPATVGGAP